MVLALVIDARWLRRQLEPEIDGDYFEDDYLKLEWIQHRFELLIRLRWIFLQVLKFDVADLECVQEGLLHNHEKVWTGLSALLEQVEVLEVFKHNLDNVNHLVDGQLRLVYLSDLRRDVAQAF